MAWFASGLLTNPVDGQILVDTGQLAAQNVTGCIMIWSDVPCNIFFQHRNAANSADLQSQKIMQGGFATAFLALPNLGPIPIATNERLRLVLEKGFTGTISCSLIG